MKTTEDFMDWTSLPAYVEEAGKIKDYLNQRSYQELKALWQCNDTIASLNQGRIREMSLTQGLVPALLAYEGLQYQYMAPQVFDDGQWDYVNRHLCILSGFYGCLKPTDGVTPYRLEMQARFSPPFEGAKNLYGFWAEKIYQELTRDSRLIVNLASKEYSRSIEKFLTSSDRMISCTFGSLSQVKGVEKVRVKATEAKMARGEMVRYMASRQITDPENIKDFNSLDYQYSPAHSTADHFVFLKF